MSTNPYLNEIRINLPRLLSLFDVDKTSLSYGMGDRYHWAWGLIDFGNGTFQGASHGLARLWSSGLWPYQTSEAKFLGRIDAIVQAAIRLTRSDGSLEEAFPREGSYCVTALVAFDLLCTCDLLADLVSAKQAREWQACIRPMINYLVLADETHALISNHLATAVAALNRWFLLTGDVKAGSKAKQLLQRILFHQSDEGWFCEYEGADPGYQSLCTYYLADVHLLRPDWNLIEPLSRSICFLQHFAHPDGSFGGHYGSRSTRIYYPAGVRALADELPEASALASFMEKSIAKKNTVTLSSIDEPNLIPVFNAYAWSAVQHDELQLISELCVPSQTPVSFRNLYSDAGLLIDRGPSHYSIISLHKGGVVYHFSDVLNSPFIDTGIVIRHRRGRLGSTQGYCKTNKIKQSACDLEITSAITEMPKALSRPEQFLILRFFSLSFFRSRLFRELIKQIMVKLLVTRKNVWPIMNRRTITLGSALSVEDNTKLKRDYCKIPDPGPFVAIHMASKGYWQMQDEQNS